MVIELGQHVMKLLERERRDPMNAWVRHNKLISWGSQKKTSWK